MNNERYKPHTYQGETSHDRPKVRYGSKAKEQPEIVHESQEKVRAFLDVLDEDALRDIFAEMFQKAGSNIETMNFVPISDVRVTWEPDVKSPAGYSVGGGLCINAHRVTQNEGKIDHGRLLWLLIHEELHAVSYAPPVGVDGVNVNNEPVGVYFDRRGVDLNVSRTMKGEYVSQSMGDKFLNEGITELLAEEVYREYLRRVGMSKGYELDVDLAVADFKNEHRQYRKYWESAEMLIALLSTLTEMDEEVLTQAFKREYLRNGYIFSEGVRETINELPLPYAPAATYARKVNRGDMMQTIKDTLEVMNDAQRTQLRDRVLAILNETQEANKAIK